MVSQEYNISNHYVEQLRDFYSNSNLMIIILHANFKKQLKVL